MKHWMLAALVCFGSSLARAQDAAPPAMTPEEVAFVKAGADAVAAAKAPAPGTLTPADWVKIGGPFGSRGQWQVGFDKSATVGSCAAYAVNAKFLMAGPCRDVLILAKDKLPIFHLGGAALYSASHTPGYVGRLGFNVGPAAKSLLEDVASKVPYLEAATDWQAPAPLAYLGKITTLDYMAGIVGGRFDHGPQLKMDLPLGDLRALLGL
ncbi:MAG: hypothetical protein V4510_09970 [bacterium]